MAFSCYSVFLRTSPTPIQLPPRLLVLDLCVCLCVYAVRMKLQSHVIQFTTVDQILLSLQIYFAPPCCGALYHGVTHTYIAPGRGGERKHVLGFLRTGAFNMQENIAN